jgi:hypothetical protein
VEDSFIKKQTGNHLEQSSFVDNKTGCSDLIIDPNNGNMPLLEFRRTGWSFSSGGTKSALYKSVDSGKTWNKIHTGFPAGQLGRIIAIAVSLIATSYILFLKQKKQN